MERHVCVYRQDSVCRSDIQSKINPLTPELNPSVQRCLPRFFTGVLIFKGFTVRSLCKSFGVKGLKNSLYRPACEDGTDRNLRRREITQKKA
jgi:hypothetical protein